MVPDHVVGFLGWCSLLNSGLLIVWGLLIVLGRRRIYSIHTRWYKLSEEEFDRIHYKGILFSKILVIVFNIVPYVVLRFLVR